MSQFVRVESIQALQDFRVALCKFTDAARTALNEAESEVQRVEHWVRLEQGLYWKSQAQRSAELVVRAKLELQRKQQQKTPLGGHYSCVDEKKALDKAKRQLEEAETKVAAVRRWSLQLEREGFEYRGACGGLSRWLEGDFPKALASLDGMLAALDKYAAMSAAGQAEALTLAPLEELVPEIAVPGADGGRTMTAGSSDEYRRLLDLVPDEQSVPAPLSEKGLAALRSGPRLNTDDQVILARLHVDRASVQADNRVVIGVSSLGYDHVFLYRRARPGDEAEWYLGPCDSLPASCEATTVGRLLAERADLREALGLAAPSMVLFAAGRLSAVYGPNAQRLWATVSGERSS